MGEKRYLRAIRLSDIHLGTRGCKAGFLLDFLRSNDSDVLYLVGDITDGWALKRSWYWDQHHNDAIQKLLRMTLELELERDVLNDLFINGYRGRSVGVAVTACLRGVPDMASAGSIRHTVNAGAVRIRSRRGSRDASP